MMKKKLLAGLATGVLMIVAGVVEAAPITFTHLGNGSGSIDSSAFSVSSFTITATADTDDVISIGEVSYVDHQTATIDIFGVGSYDFVTNTRTFVNRSSTVIGFSRVGYSGADLFNGPNNSLFASWDMLTDIGPVTGSGSLMQWDLTPVLTDGGVLEFYSGSSTATFQASSVPIPSTILLFGTGLGSLAGFRIRRKKK